MHIPDLLLRSTHRLHNNHSDVTHNTTIAHLSSSDRNYLWKEWRKKMQDWAQTMTFLNVLVQLVNKGVQLLPLLGRKLQCITGVNPLTQGAGIKQNKKMKNEKWAQIDLRSEAEAKWWAVVKEEGGERVYLVPMPCPLVPTRENRERKPSGTNHCNIVTTLLSYDGKRLKGQGCSSSKKKNNATHLLNCEDCESSLGIL